MKKYPGDPHSGLFDIADTFAGFLDSIWYEVNTFPGASMGPSE